MGVLDSAILLGLEATYGTPATLTRGYEGHADGMTRQVEYLESTGFRPGLQTLRADRRKPVLQGAEGDLELDVLDRGMGLFFSLAFGATVAPAETSAGSGVYRTVFTTAASGPAQSATIQTIRSAVGGAAVPFTYHGCVATSWKLSVETGGLLVSTISFDAEDEDTATAAGTPQYPADARPFDWTGAVVKIDGEAVDFSSFEFENSLGMKTDRRFLRASALKRQPVRSGLPEMSGTIKGEFRDTDLYSRFIAGDVMALSLEVTGDPIPDATGGETYALKLEFPAVMLDGSTPVAALDDVSTQEAPFRVLWDGTNPAATLTITSDDTAL